MTEEKSSIVSVHTVGDQLDLQVHKCRRCFADPENGTDQTPFHLPRVDHGHHIPDPSHCDQWPEDLGVGP